MKRRGARDNQSSLFAFQDVMAGLIGIVFFVVLLMSLDMVEGASQPMQTVDAEVLEKLRAELDVKQAELDALQGEVESLTDRLNAATDFSPVLLRRQIAELEAGIEAVEAMIEAVEARLGSVLVERELVEAKTTDRAREVRALQDELDLLGDASNVERANVKFLVGSGVRQTAWLVEITEDQLTVGSQEGDIACVFRGGTPQQRADDFFNWARRFSRTDYYFVLVTKPSGFEQSVELRTRLMASRYHIGMDYLPEQWRPFNEE